MKILSGKVLNLTRFGKIAKEIKDTNCGKLAKEMTDDIGSRTAERNKEAEQRSHDRGEGFL